MKNFTTFKNEIKKCEGCSLCGTRTTVVLGDFQPKAKIMLIGEAPGGKEDLEGKPFCGQAGEILHDLLKLADLKLEDVYISNTVKCRPTKPSKSGRYGDFANRKPLKPEINACAKWLDTEIEIIKPKILVTLGAVPLARLLGKTVKMQDYHGKMLEVGNMQIFPLYHPAALIYDRSKTPAYEEDVKFLGELCKCDV